MANVGKFTGDVLNSGYGLGRASSRVINPPGGKCSDIFGGGPATSYTTSSSTSVPAPVDRSSAAAHSKRNDSTVFRSPVRSVTSDAHIEAAARRGTSKVFAPESPAGPPRKVPDPEQVAYTTSGISNVFGAFEQPSAASQQQTASPRRRGPGAYQRPEAVESHKARGVHTSSRVLAPPGGKCSNIFG
jgi:hypothetical protein